MEVWLPSLSTAKERAGSSENTRSAESPGGRHIGVRWRFLTNHAHILVLLALYPSIVLREVATRVGLTERAVQRIIQELEQDGFIIREKVGRQNRYQVSRDRNLRHPVAEHCTVQGLIDLMFGGRASQC